MPTLAVHPSHAWEFLLLLLQGSVGCDLKPLTWPDECQQRALLVAIRPGLGLSPPGEEKGGQQVHRLSHLLLLSLAHVLGAVPDSLVPAENFHSAVEAWEGVGVCVGVMFLDVALVLYRVFQRGFSLFLSFGWEVKGRRKFSYLRDIEIGKKLSFL